MCSLQKQHDDVFFFKFSSSFPKRKLQVCRKQKGALQRALRTGKQTCQTESNCRHGAYTREHKHVAACCNFAQMRVDILSGLQPYSYALEPCRTWSGTHMHDEKYRMGHCRESRHRKKHTGRCHHAVSYAPSTLSRGGSGGRITTV